MRPTTPATTTTPDGTAPRLPGPPRRTVLLGLTALAAAGCSGGGGAGADGLDPEAQSDAAMADYAADSQFTATVPLTVSMLWTDWPENPVTDSWEVFDEIARRTGVTLELTHIPFSDATEKRSLLISAGDAPSVIPLVYTGEEEPFVASGAVLPMSDYVQYMPHFGKYVEEWDLTDMMDQLRQTDGKYYMLPGFQEVSVPSFTLVIRKDAFDEVGAGVPGTWEEVRAALRLLKERHPDSTPLADGFEGQSMLNYAAHAWGVRAGWGFGDGMLLDPDSGDLVYAATTEGYRTMLEFFHGMVAEGLVDTESFGAADATGSTVEEKVAAGTVFAASGTNGTVTSFGTALDATAGAGNHEVVEIAPPGGEAGQVVEPRNFWNGFMLNAELAGSPNLLAVLQFVDWLYYNPDAREMLRWGVEGETYTKAADGSITLAGGYSLDAYALGAGEPVDLQTDLGYSNSVLADSTESRALKESYNSAAYTAYVDSVLSTRTPVDPFPSVPLDEAQLEQASLLATPLKDAVDTATLQFVLGQRDLSEWDGYVAELEAAGLGSYLELMNQAYAAARAGEA